MATRVSLCRLCGSSKLEEFLSLGDMPPVNSFLSTPQEIAAEQGHPLAVAFCSACTHVQLTHMLDPRDVFTDYIYFSSMSETIVRYGESLAARYASEFGLKKNDLVVELASNDGCILRPFQEHCRVLGVEPAKNIAEVANGVGVPTIAEFFDSKSGDALRAEYGPARLILARNVLAHVPEAIDFVRAAGRWLADDGILHVEVPYLKEMVENLEFDTIYHEHLSYFSVTMLERLFAQAGLVLWDVEDIRLHGGSLIARARKPGALARPAVGRYLGSEQVAGYRGIEPLLRFAEGTRHLKERIPNFLGDLKRRGHRLAGYGAAAKGVVLLNYCGVGSELLDFVADRSPYKQGKKMPGIHLPVVSPDEVTKHQPDYLFMLAWNFFDEIARQQAPYLRAGGKFLVPLPEPRVASAPLDVA